jgi:hypothetical protein
MISKANHPIDQLRDLAANYRHLKGEHCRGGEAGSWRRQLESQMAELEQKFETLLAQWVPDKNDSGIWQDYFHNGGAEPEDDLERYQPIFVGRSPVGSVVEIRESSQGNYEVIVDGTQTQRLPSTFSLGDYPSPTVSLMGQGWTEFSRASEPARQALKDYIDSATGYPPWQWARELFTDGLIDLTFGLTSRGRRILK